MQLCYIKHEQKKKLYLCWRHSPRCSVRSQSANFDATTSSSLFYFLLLCCAVWFCFPERCYKMPQTSHWGAFFPSLPFVVSLGLLQSTLGVVSPSSVSSVVPFDLCCAQLFSPLIIRCLSYLKKNPGGTYLRCNAVFSLFSISVFQGEASQTNLFLCFILQYRQTPNDNQLLYLCHGFVLPLITPGGSELCPNLL